MAHQFGEIVDRSKCLCFRASSRQPIERNADIANSPIITRRMYGAARRKKGAVKLANSVRHNLPSRDVLMASGY